MMDESGVIEPTLTAAPPAATTTQRRPRFWLKLALFALPFALAFLIFSGFLVYTGESVPMSTVIALQMSDSPVMYRPRFGARDATFKMLSIDARKPQIITIGSSHVLQFRSMFFNRQPHAFYNAGGPAFSLDQVEEILRRIDPDALPKFVIFGIDSVWFNDAYVYPIDYQAHDPNDLETLFQVNRGVMQILLQKEPIDVGLLLARREPLRGGLALGWRAIRDGQGYRNDGSEQFGDFIVKHYLWPQNERQHHLDLLRDGKEMYIPGDTVSPSRLAQMERILQFCRQHGIQPIGFPQVFSPTQYQQMMADGQHTYVWKLTPLLQDLFARYGGRYFDYSNGAALGGTDDDFYDGWHASERLTLHMYIEFLKQMPNVFAPYSDLDFLQKAEKDAHDTFDVFGDQIAP